MKKEIKKLQRLRDFFRSNQSNPDIKDKSKLDQGRKMIENVSDFSVTNNYSVGNGKVQGAREGIQDEVVFEESTLGGL